MTDPIYLDNNATTPLYPRVLDAMLPWGGLLVVAVDKRQ